MTWRSALRVALTLGSAFALGMSGAVTAQGHAPAQAGNETREAAKDDAAREILVMLKMSPPHFRPGQNYGGTYGDTISIAARRRIAQAIARRHRLELVDGWPMPLLGVDCYTMRVPAGVELADAITQVSHDPMVAWSQALQLYRTRGASPQPADDPLFRVEPAATAWRLAELHRVSTGRGVSVAVIDSRIEVTHPDLSGQFIADQNFVSGHGDGAERHGTGVAGIIGAKADNGIGVAGVAPGARMMALRACWQTSNGMAAGPTLCDSLSLARALQYAIEHRAQVINLSLSGPPDMLLAKLIDVALARNASVVAAFDPNLRGGGFPASVPGVKAVADESLQSLPSGVYGAPGRDVPTTQPGGKWYLVNGSSYAVAHVSGLIALVREQRRGAAADPVVLVRETSGAIDACATLLKTSPDCDCSCALGRQMAKNGRR